MVCELLPKQSGGGCDGRFPVQQRVRPALQRGQSKPQSILYVNKKYTKKLHREETHTHREKKGTIVLSIHFSSDGHAFFRTGCLFFLAVSSLFWGVGFFRVDVGFRNAGKI